MNSTRTSKNSSPNTAVNTIAAFAECRKLAAKCEHLVVSNEVAKVMWRFCRYVHTTPVG